MEGRGGRGQRDDSVSAVNLGSFFVRLVFTFIISFGILSFFSNHFFFVRFYFYFSPAQAYSPLIEIVILIVDNHNDDGTISSG